MIVKHAAPETWNLYFEGDPQEGVHASYSAHDTYTGQVVGIRSCYTTKEFAQEDLKKMLAENPSGCYAVCPITIQF